MWKKNSNFGPVLIVKKKGFPQCMVSCRLSGLGEIIKKDFFESLRTWISVLYILYQRKNQPGGMEMTWKCKKEEDNWEIERKIRLKDRKIMPPAGLTRLL